MIDYWRSAHCWHNDGDSLKCCRCPARIPKPWLKAIEEATEAEEGVSDLDSRRKEAVAPGCPI